MPLEELEALDELEVLPLVIPEEDPDDALEEPDELEVLPLDPEPPEEPLDEPVEEALARPELEPVVPPPGSLPSAQASKP
jgi:hypothetical protein